MIKLLFLLLCIVSFQVQAQDTLLLINNTRIECKVVEVRSNSIDYKNTKENKKDLYNINKELVQYIFYNSGAIDTINPILKKQADTTSHINKTDTFSNDNRGGLDEYEKGKADGYKEYRRENVLAMNGVAGAFLSVYGIFVPMINQFSRANPADFTSSSYLSNTNKYYRQGYVTGATKKKHRQGWTSFGLGVGINAVIIGTAFLLSL